MNLVKYRPLTGGLLEREFDRFFNDLTGDTFWDLDRNHPKVDVHEEKDRYVLEADLPGLTEKDVEVKVENNLLSISSSKKEEKEEKKDGYIMRERRGYSFARSFVLPEDVNREAIEAKFQNGVLTLFLVKHPEAQPKKIEIKGA
jgi:HSP20 family protein